MHRTKLLSIALVLLLAFGRKFANETNYNQPSYNGVQAGNAKQGDAKEGQVKVLPEGEKMLYSLNQPSGAHAGDVKQGDIKGGDEVQGYCPWIEPPEGGTLVTDCGYKTQGEKCKFRCDRGYTMIGDDELTCINLRWKGELPRCENSQPPCPMLNKIKNGNTKCTIKYCQIFCDEGFAVIGYQELHCNNGLWDHPSPYCAAESPCPMLNYIEHGTANCKHNLQSCQIVCDEGYSVEGYDELFCENGVWNHPAGQCVGAESPCPMLNKIEHGIANCNLQSCQIVCDEGYTVEGYDELSCENGAWNHPAAQCVVAESPCPMLNKIEHGIAKCNLQSCQIVCDEGYTVEGYDELSCENGAWNHPAPECVETEHESISENCPELEIPDNVFYDGFCKKAMRGESCKFKCLENVILEGKSEIFCTWNLVWSGPVPQCKYSEICKNPSKPAHGDVKCNDGNTKCEFTCNGEYKLDGSRSITCDQGTWSNAEPRCIKPDNCPAIIKPDNVILDGYCSKAARGQSCKFKCKDNLLLEGADELFCTWRLTWSGTVPYCKISKACETPQKPDHGNVVCGEGNVGLYCKFSCDPDYKIHGKNKIICRAGKWDDQAPTCKKRTETETCPALDKPDNVIWNGFCTRATRGQSCKFRCEDNFILEGDNEIFCSQNLIWSGTAPYCKSSQTDYCPALVIPANVIWYGICTKASPGQSCKFKCKDNLILEGVHQLICTRIFTWNGAVPKCKIPRTETDYCPELAIPENVILDGFCTKATRGQSCKFKCKDNFILEGVQQLFCTEFLTWNNAVPRCKTPQKDYCPELEIPDSMICTGYCSNAPVGQLCICKCRENFIQQGTSNLFCTRSLKWNAVLPRCTYSEYSCQAPSKPAHGDVACSLGNAECEFSCKRGYKLRGHRRITCHQGRWSHNTARCIKNCYHGSGGCRNCYCDDSHDRTLPYHPQDCATIKKFNPRLQNGIYMIWPKMMKESLEVLCDMTTDNGGWTIFQKRGDYKSNETEDFLRKWDHYVKGFGNLEKEYWLGLDAIHAMTSNEPQTLRIDMADYDGVSKYAKYNTFSVSGSGDHYKLQISGFSGDAGDSLAYHNNMRFSTMDSGVTDCVRWFKGGWWYDWCHHSHLNGNNLRGKITSTGQGINWSSFRGNHYSLKSAEMKMRPRQY